MQLVNREYTPLLTAALIKINEVSPALNYGFPRVLLTN
jgi:hypothetical protein